MSLPQGLTLNAAFSFATGLMLTAAPGVIGDWLGVSINGWLRALGVILLGHASVLMWASRQTSIVSWTKVNVAAIAPYPVLMLGVIVWGAVDTPLGRALVLFDALVVGALAVMQWTGLRNTADGAHPVHA